MAFSTRNGYVLTWQMREHSSFARLTHFPTTISAQLPGPGEHLVLLSLRLGVMRLQAKFNDASLAIDVAYIT